MANLSAPDARVVSDFICDNWTAFVQHVADLEGLDYDDEVEGDSPAAERADGIHTAILDIIDMS